MKKIKVKLKILLVYSFDPPYRGLLIKFDSKSGSSNRVRVRFSPSAPYYLPNVRFILEADGHLVPYN